MNSLDPEFNYYCTNPGFVIEYEPDKLNEALRKVKRMSKEVTVTRTVKGELIISVVVAIASVNPQTGAFDRTQLDNFTVNSLDEIIKRFKELKIEDIPVPF